MTSSFYRNFFYSVCYSPGLKMSRIQTTRLDGLAPISITDTTSKSAIFSPFFGEPPGGPIRTDPYERQANQNLALPDAYRGRSTYLGQAIEFQIRTEDDWYTGRMLPIREADTLSITWNKWTFDQHRTTRVPEEAPSRLITNRRSQTSRSMERQGIMFQLEHGFMKTQQGVDNYIYNLRQMAYAVSETNKQDVIMAYLNAKDVYMVWEKRHGHYNNRTIKQRLDMERDNWACVQKDEMGLSKLDAKSDEEMMKVHGRADTWLLPPKMQLFAKFQPHETDYYLSGKTWSYDSKDTFGLIGNKRAYLMRQYDIDVSGLQDISIRERQIGQYYTMVDRYSISRKDGDEYTNEERSIIVYDEDMDRWHKLTLDLAIENANIWDADGKVEPIDGLSENATNVPHEQDKEYDFLSMPLNAGKRAPVAFVGQLSEEALKTSSLIGIARTAIKSFGMSEASLATVAQSLIQFMDMNNSPLTVAQVTGLFDTDNALKSFDKIDTYMQMVPPGNQYQDFKASGLSAEQKIIARQLDDTDYKRFVRALRSVFRDSVFLDDKWVGPISAFMGQSNMSGRLLSESLLGGVGLPVWIRKTPGTIGNDRLKIMDSNNLASLRSLIPLVRNLAAMKGVPLDNDRVKALGKALEKLFGFKTNVGEGKFEDWQKADNNDGGPASDEGIKARGFHQVILKADGSALVMPNGATQAKYKFRERLIALIQTMITRLFTAKPSDASVDGLKALIGKIETKIQTATGAAAAAAKPGTVWGTLMADAEISAFGTPGSFPKLMDMDNSFPDTTAIKNELDATPDTAINPAVIAAGLDVPQVNEAFYITPMFLTLAQLRSILFELVGTASTVEQIQAVMDKAKITVSIPSQLDKPITSGADMKLMIDMLRDPKSRLSIDLGWSGEDFKKSPLYTFLEAASAKRKRRAEGAADEDGRYARHDEEEEEVQAGLRFSFPIGFELPSLTSVQFVRRMQHIDRQMVNPLHKFVAKIIAAMPFTKQTLLTLYNNNINVPVGFIVACPHMRYHMHFAIKALAGSETGNTYIKDIDFEVGDDIHNKMHWGHLTLYSKAIVREEKNVRVFYDIFSGQCLGGAGVKIIKADHTYNPHESLYGNGSLLFLMVSYEEQEFPNPLDISGHFSYFNDSSNTDRDSEEKRPHYTTAYRYNKRFGWRRVEDIGKFAVEQMFHPLIYQPQEDRLPFNTVCYHGEEHYYNRNSRLFDIEHTNTGHWGPFCFPGARKLRDGDLSVWKQPTKLLKI